jgi:hypothetical protein
MRENTTSAGDTPATRAAPTGGADYDQIEQDAAPAAAVLRSGLGACRALIDACARMANDDDQTQTAKTHAASVAARLASASAQAASAIARLADAETRQRLATARLQSAFRPKRHPAPPPRPLQSATFQSYNSADWPDDDESDEANLNFNSPSAYDGPRVRQP